MNIEYAYSSSQKKRRPGSSTTAGHIPPRNIKNVTRRTDDQLAEQETGILKKKLQSMTVLQNAYNDDGDHDS